MPVGDALRMRFPPHLFISLVYLYISLWAQPLAEQALGPGLFLFISLRLLGDSLLESRDCLRLIWLR